MRLSPRNTWLTKLLALVAICPLAIYAQTAGAAAEEQLDAKLEVYIECYNSLDGDGHKTIERYQSWVKDMKAGPTGKEMVVYGLYQIGTDDVTKCKGQFAEVQALKPELKLDGVGAEYIKALESLNQVVEEMYPYYDREDYKDDKFAKGKEFHPRFVAQIEAFQAVSKQFSDELDLENDKRLEAEMVALEKEQGRKLPYLNMATMHTAKLLVRLLGEDAFPVDEAATRLTAFEKVADEQAQFAKANPQGLPPMWSLFTGQIEDFRKAAKERVRRIRDKTPYNDGEAMLIKANSGWMVAGSQEKIIKVYNELITRSNSLN